MAEEEIVFDEGFGEDPNDARADNDMINAPRGDEHPAIDPQELEELRRSHSVVQQFNTNPMQSIQQIAAQMGLELRPKDTQTQQAHPEQPSQTQRVEDMIEDESMKFLAPMIAKVAEKIADQKVKETIEPLQRSQQEISTRNRQQEYQQAAQQLSEQYPDWGSREPDMQARLEFIRSAMNGGPLVHHKFGNVLEMLYSWANGNNSARREVAERYREAPRQRAVTSNDNRARNPNILQTIADVKDPNRQFEIAFNEAVREVIG